jgi:hypothetical protein
LSSSQIWAIVEEMRILAILGCLFCLATANAQNNEPVKATIGNLGTEPAPYVPPQDAPPQDAPPPAPRVVHTGMAPQVPAPTVAARKIQKYIDAYVPIHAELTEQQRGEIAIVRGYLDTSEGKELADLADTQLSIERSFHVVPEADIIERMNDILRVRQQQANAPAPVVTQQQNAQQQHAAVNAVKKEHHKMRTFVNFLGTVTVAVYCRNLESKPLIQFTPIDAQNLQNCRALGL